MNQTHPAERSWLDRFLCAGWAGYQRVGQL